MLAYKIMRVFSNAGVRKLVHSFFHILSSIIIYYKTTFWFISITATFKSILKPVGVNTKWYGLIVQCTPLSTSSKLVCNLKWELFYSMGYILLVMYGVQVLQSSGIIKQKSPALWGVFFLALVFAGRTLLRNQDWSSREALVR